MFTWTVPEPFPSELLASEIRESIMKNTRTACTIMATSIPPAWSKACGKFRSPAPRAALTTRNIVPIILVPSAEPNRKLRQERKIYENSSNLGLHLQQSFVEQSSRKMDLLVELYRRQPSDLIVGKFRHLQLRLPCCYELSMYTHTLIHTIWVLRENWEGC